MSDQWTNRTEIRSETSSRVYVVAQNRVKRFWSCSCPSWRVRRACKHLRSMGLPCHEEPFELPKKKTDFMGVYKHYDRASERPGDSASWRESLSALQETEAPEAAAEAYPVSAPVITSSGPARRLRTMKSLTCPPQARKVRQTWRKGE